MGMIAGERIRRDSWQRRKGRWRGDGAIQQMGGARMRDK
jgi:ribosomal protein L19E